MKCIYHHTYSPYTPSNSLHIPIISLPNLMSLFNDPLIQLVMPRIIFLSPTTFHFQQSLSMGLSPQIIYPAYTGVWAGLIL